MVVKLLTEHHLEFLSLKGGCRGLSKSTHVKMPHCWKSHATAHVKLASTQELSTCLHIETLHTYTIFHSCKPNLLSSVDNLCNFFGPRSEPTECTLSIIL